MKILVINTGSSSIKYELFDMTRQRVMASGMAEKIGEKRSLLTYMRIPPGGEPTEKRDAAIISDHRQGMNRIVDFLINPDYGAIRDKDEISAIGHRVVHGGETFQATTVIDEAVIAAIKENIPLAPLHNPSNLIGIEIAGSVFPNALQVAVFDTAFHQTIPMKAFLYAIPYEMYEKERIRRYGFHGTSHAYVTQRAAVYMGRPLEELNLITIHLGNGASMAAIKKGKSVDTTMGMTPLAGLVMGTRSGDVDPALPFFLAEHLKMSLKGIETLLNNQSGLKGICGTNDMRDVIKEMGAGGDRAKIALDVYAYRIKKYIGAYFAVLGKVDAVVFTAGIGENAPYIRELCCRDLNRLGMVVDPERNNMAENKVREISPPNSEVKVLVIPTDEELEIAKQTKKAVESERRIGR